MKSTQNDIKAAFKAENWKEARRLLQQELKRDPESHWLLTRLSTTYHEEKKYEKALELSRRALELAPNCPLVQWDHAGAMEMLDRTEEAIQIWKRLLRRGKRLETDPCSEGPKWCASLLNDCRYRLALAYGCRQQTELAIRSLRAYLAGLDRGTESIYDRTHAEARLSDLLATLSSSEQSA